jgi:hypothetical protein
MSKSSVEQLPTDYPFALERHYHDGFSRCAALTQPLYKPHDPRTMRGHLATYLDSLRERFLGPKDLLFPPMPCWFTLLALVRAAAISLRYKRKILTSYRNAIRFIEGHWPKIGISIFLDDIVDKMTHLPRHPQALIVYQIEKDLPGEQVAAWHLERGLCQLQLKPSAKECQDPEVSMLAELFNLLGTDDNPPTLPAERWAQYYELLQPLITRSFAALIEGLRGKAVPGVDHVVLRDQMKRQWGFIVVSELRREQRSWERRFSDKREHTSKQTPLECILDTGLGLSLMATPACETRLRKVIYPWDMTPTVVDLINRRKVDHMRQLELRAKATGATPHLVYRFIKRGTYC